MSISRIVMIGGMALFLLIGVISLFKKSPQKQTDDFAYKKEEVIEIKPVVEEILIHDDAKQQLPLETKEIVLEDDKEKAPPQVDCINQLFATDSSKLNIVETVTYSSRVPWLKDRPAWIADYAAYYETTRHFIARSLNKKEDYFTQKVSPGDRFNVLNKEKDIQFHLIIDLSRTKMWFYAVDKTANEKILLKTYNVGVGRKDSLRKSGYLTPIGKYLLGSKVAIYKPGTMGYFQDKKIEMIRVFGTRWIPFEKEIDDCTEPAKGFGLHGVPWDNDASSALLAEDRGPIGKYDSDGCVRLASEDIEEIFSIVITKPTVVELVNDFYQSAFVDQEK